MAKKIYNKNAREAHLMAEAYENVIEEGRLGNIAKGAAGGAATALIAGQLGPQVAAPEEIVTVPIGAVLGGIGGALKDPNEDQEDTPRVGDIFDGIDYDEMIIAIEDDGTIYTRELAEGGNRYSADEFTYQIKDRITI